MMTDLIPSLQLDWTRHIWHMFHIGAGCMFPLGSEPSPISIHYDQSKARGDDLK